MTSGTKRTWGLMAVAACVLLVGTGLRAGDEVKGAGGGKVYSEGEALKIGWPGLAGPLGTFEAVPIGTPLVSDLSQAKKVWESECADFGRAKGGSKAFRGMAQFTPEGIAKFGNHPGSWAGLIVGDGLVYGASWRPTGEWASVEGSKVRLDAEDFVVAIDPATGKTKWQTFEPGGLLRGGGKRQGFQVGPVFHNGTVFALTSTAKLLAIDGATGKKKWESEAMPARGAQKKAREEALAALAAGKWPKYDLAPNWCASLGVVGEALIVPDQAGGLVGVDLATGTKKWSAKGVTSRWATPTGWRSGDKEYLVAANEKGELRMIDPESGKEMWKMSGLGPNWPTLTVGKTHVLVNIVADSGKAKGKDRVSGRYGAIKLSTTGGEKAWEAPKDHLIPVWMDAGARMRVMYQNGRFLLAHVKAEANDAEEAGDAPAKAKAVDPKPGDAAAAPKERSTTPAYLLEEATGKVLCSFKAPTEGRDHEIAGQIYWCGDRLITRGDSYHGPTHGGRHPWSYWSVSADNQIGELPGNMDLGEFTNGYEVGMEVPMVAGLMFERTEKGTVLCYDLRRK